MTAVPEPYITLQEYFLLEETGEIKHEYYDGAIFDMTGASVQHNLLVAAIIACLHPQLREKASSVFPSDLRVKVEATGLYTYPDVLVICGMPHTADGRGDTVTNPTVLIEVLSPSTEGYDRGGKFHHYRTIASLREYLLIAQESMHIEQYVRKKGNRWLLEEFTRADQVIRLASIDCTLALEMVYEKVALDK